MNIPFLVSAFLISISLISFSEGDEKSKARTMYNDIKNDFPKVPEFTIEDLKNLKKNTYILVDVRENNERKISTISGAISGDLFNKNKEKYKRKKIIVFCTIGYRSAKFVAKIRKEGLNAYNLEGSLLGWIHAGGAIVAPGGKPTNKIHVYGSKWNHVPRGFEGVW